MPQEQLSFPTQLPTNIAPRRMPCLIAPDPNMHGGATGYNLISTLALYLKTKQLVIAECEPMPKRKPTLGAQLLAQGAPAGYQCQPVIPATISLVPPYQSYSSYERDLILSHFTDKQNEL